MLLVRNKNKTKRVKFKRKAIKNAETLDKQLASHAKKKKITKQRINELISEGERDVKRFHSKIMRDTNEHIYQTPLRLLVKFEEEEFKKKQRHTLGETLEDNQNY